MLRNFFIFLFIVALLIIGAFITVRFEELRVLGILIIILSWLLTLLYQQSSFYPNDIKSLPRKKLYRILDKWRKNEKFIFRVGEIGEDGFIHKTKILVHSENIHEWYFKITEKREMEILPIK